MSCCWTGPHIPVNSEAGGPAVLSGLMIRALDGDGGVFTAAQLEAALRPPGNRYMPRSRVVSVEQTSNLGGGRVWPLSTVQSVLEVARQHGLRAHMDGARLMNAVVASGVSAADFAGGFDTAWIDFTKGLGAPVGAVLAGSRELIDEAWRWKQMLGGAFRQSGIVAAGCLYALDHHVDRLAEDHAHARLLAEGLASLPRRAARPGLGRDQHRDLSTWRTRGRWWRGSPIVSRSRRSTRTACVRSPIWTSRVRTWSERSRRSRTSSAEFCSIQIGQNHPMTRRKPAGARWESWIDHQIREAEERGEFDDLPGAGKPIPDLDKPFDEMWWVKDKLRREGLSYMSPTVALRKEAHDALVAASRASSEAEVRKIISAINEKIREANRNAIAGRR